MLTQSKLIDFVEFDDLNNQIFIDGNQYNTLEIEYDEITSIEMADIVRAQLGYVKSLVEIQLDERKSTMDDDVYTSWSFSARRCMARADRLIRLCDAKRGALLRSNKIDKNSG
ncbi:MAG: hypothetical protein DHS20C08_04510 [Rhodomicrobium sp.]|nr:MAG: hypothetical protein DHS20C08_04510 [Rhodomicrobium sp.]